MRVMCARRFRDIENGVFREVGDTFEVDEKRYEAINSAGYGVLVKKVEETPSEGVSEPQKTVADKPKPATRRRGRTRKTVEE